ncbi:MAG: EAL domain-containing protein [Thermodesulfobacteriota bacterium]
MRLPSRRPFLSLKWKAIVLTSLILGGLASWFTVRGYRDQLAQFERERRLAHARYQTEVAGLLAESLQRLRQVGALVPTLAGMGLSLRSEDPALVRTAFDEHWPLLQINMGLEVARIYDSGARLLGAWGRSGLPDSLPAPVPAWVLDANSREQPRSGVECRDDCMQYAAVPLLDQGRNRGVVVLGASLADMVLSFRKVSDADVGVLAGASWGGVGDRRGRILEPWRVRVAALSGEPKTWEVLRRASERHPSLEALAAGVRVEHESQTYEVLLLPLEGFPTGEKAHLAVITNVSRPLAEILAAARTQFHVGLAVLVLGEGLLLALLGPPMARLRRTAENLPLLAERRFSQLREILGSGRRPARVRDEIEVLDDTTVTLAGRLETLEEELRTHGVALQSQMQALSAERDFVTSLLETAQVLVLTQTREGRITMVNPFGRALLGDPARGESVSFDAVADLTDDLPDLKGRIAAVADGRPPKFQHETELRCRDGSVRHITWIHSRLLRHGGQEPQILSVGVDVTARKSAETRLAWLADHDPLTGLCNRKRFAEEVARALAVSQRYRRTGAVLVVDLDQFKYVNDTAGHQAGDLLLNVVGHALARVVRSVDTLARLSSDEFAILVPETSEAGAVELAKKISAEIEGIAFPVDGGRHRIGASIGITLFPQEGAEAAEVLAAADLAMNQAKEAGRGRWHLYSSKTQARRLMHDNVYWKNRVEQALAQDRLVMYYQPILHVESGEVTHYEALLRMLEADGTPIPPGKFIPACERTGLIHAVDNAVIEKVVAQLGRLTPSLPETRMHINVSAYAFGNPEFVHNLRQTLEDHAVAPDRVVLEVTETATVADFAAARALMEEIRKLGCSLALDDFGVGFSSLGYLKELPVDYVKIDGSFIRRLHENRDDQILVRAMGEVARGFGKKIVAEYVENETILELLGSYGIDFAQGYAIGKPQPAEETFPETLAGTASGEGFELLIL